MNLFFTERENWSHHFQVGLHTANYHGFVLWLNGINNDVQNLPIFSFILDERVAKVWLSVQYPEYLIYSWMSDDVIVFHLHVGDIV